MRPTTNFMLHALAAAMLTAFAATSAAAQYLVLGDSIPAAGPNKDSREKWIEIQSYSFGATQPARVSKVDSFTVKQGVKPYKLDRVFVKSWSTSGDAGSVGGAKQETIGAAHSPDVATGQATGKRQHKPLRMRMEYDGGSVTVGGRLAACRAGAAYPGATIEANGELFELQDVVIAGCTANSATLNFAKVKVRGWDPEKKEE